MFQNELVRHLKDKLGPEAKVMDWRKDKGKIEDHKTFLDVPALQVCLGRYFIKECRF